MRDTTDELNAAEVDSTNVDDMFTVSVSNSNLKHHGHHSGAKPGVSLSAAESSHASIISRTPKGRKEVKDAHYAPVGSAQMALVSTASNSVTSQSKKRKLLVQLTPAEPNTTSRARRLSAAAASDWFQTQSGKVPTEPPKNLLNAMRPAPLIQNSNDTQRPQADEEAVAAMESTGFGAYVER